MTIPECLSEIGKNVLQKTCQLDFNLHKVLINTTYTAIDQTKEFLKTTYKKREHYKKPADSGVS